MQEVNPRRRAGIILNALTSGKAVTLGQHRFRLFAPGETIPAPSMDGESDEWFLGVECDVVNTQTQTTEKKVLGIDLTLTDFLNKVARMSNDDVVTIAMENVLRELKPQRLASAHTRAINP